MPRRWHGGFAPLGSASDAPRTRLAAVPKVSANWPVFGEPKLATMPAVLSAIWRAEDGNLGLFIVNLSDEKQTYRYAYDPAKYELLASKLSYTVITESGAGERMIAEGDSQSRSVALEPFGVAVYEVAPA